LDKRRRQEARKLKAGTYLKLCRAGFFPNKNELYHFSRFEKKDYITDQQMLMTSYIDREYANVLNNKVLFELAMGPFVHVPHNFAFIHQGIFISLDSKVHEFSDIRDILLRNKYLIVKPTNGVSGQGITLLHYNGEGFLANGHQKRWSDILKNILASDDVLICEYVQQSEFGKTFFPHTVNTVRMLTMRNPESRTSFIAAAALRIGGSCSIPVDNISAGGLVCGIDLKSGCLQKAATGFFGNGTFRWIEKHPDTGLRLEGITLEGWDIMCKKIQETADKFPYLPYIAWDVAMGQNGIVVIEGNTWSDVSIFQIYRPMLLDSRVRSFLKYHRII